VIGKMAKALQDENGWTRTSSVTEPLNLSKPRADQPTDDIKQTLKSLIKSRRIAEGKDELQVEFKIEKRRCEVKTQYAKFQTCKNSVNI
jgi:hypothetical protein